MAEKEYIEREAAIEDICERLKMTHPSGIEYSNADVRAFVVALISPIPAADVRPVVRGKWIMTTERFAPERICSSCKCRFPVSAGECITEVLNYCPNCGARMEES